MYRNSSLMRRVLLIIIVAVSIASSALATDKPVTTAGSKSAPELEIPEEHLAILSTQCGPFMIWTSSKSHFLWLFFDTSGNYYFFPPESKENIVVNNMLVVPNVVSAEQIGMGNKSVRGFSLLDAHLKWEIDFLKKHHGFSDITWSVKFEKGVDDKSPRHIRVVLLQYPGSVDVFNFPVARWLIGTATIESDVVAIGAPVRETDDQKQAILYLKHVLQGITHFKSREELIDYVRKLQQQSLIAHDCKEFMSQCCGERPLVWP
jgi:hypothetical protein